MNLSAFLYALLAALTGLSLGAGVVEEPRVAERSLASRAEVVRQVVLAVVREAGAPLAMVDAPRAILSIDGASLSLQGTPLDQRPSRRRE